MKAVIPLAGLGSRLKPHTHTTPKPLMDVAGKPILEHVIEELEKLNLDEIIFVVGYLRNAVQDYVRENHPNLNCRFVYQKIRDGDGSAIRLALEDIEEEDDLYIIFGADTLIDFDVKKAIDTLPRKSDGLIFGMEVEEPSNYGIMNVDSKLEIYEVEEKPANPKSNLAIIGAYYFRSLQDVKKTLFDFYKMNDTVKGEYKIIQVIEKYILDKNKDIRAAKVNKWFDCGRPSVLLEANKYFLEKKSNNKVVKRGTSVIIPPSYVSKSATLNHSVIGPYASIGEDVVVEDAVVKNSIVSRESQIRNIILKNSLVGKEVVLEGKPSKINIGEKSHLSLE